MIEQMITDTRAYQDAENAAIYRNLVAKLMPPTDVAKSQGLAREWHEKNARGNTQN